MNSSSRRCGDVDTVQFEEGDGDLRHFHVNRENRASQRKQVSLHLLIFVNLISLLLRAVIDRMQQLDHHPRLCFMNLHSSFPFFFGFI